MKIKCPRCGRIFDAKDILKDPFYIAQHVGCPKCFINFNTSEKNVIIDEDF